MMKKMFTVLTMLVMVFGLTVSAYGAETGVINTIDFTGDNGTLTKDSDGTVIVFIDDTNAQGIVVGDRVHFDLNASGQAIDLGKIVGIESGVIQEINGFQNGGFIQKDSDGSIIPFQHDATGFSVGDHVRFEIDASGVALNLQPFSDITTGLVAYYPFNGNAIDESGNGNDGTVFQATLIEDRFGISESAYYFDGNNDYIDVDTLASKILNPSQDIGTISLWFKGDSNAVHGGPLIWFGGFYFSLGSWSSQLPSSSIGYWSPCIHMGYQNGINFYYDDQWHHAAMVMGSNYNALYVDGVKFQPQQLDYVILSVDYADFATGSPNKGNCMWGLPNASWAREEVKIGSRPVGSPGGRYEYTGAIDDIRLYSRDLSETEIQELYNQVPPNQPPVADAGAGQNIYLTEMAYLDGSNSSDPDGDPIASYLWAIDSAPAGSGASLSCTTCVNPSITPDVIGEYIISLVVNDGTDDSAADTLSITVTENLPPIALATGVPATGFFPLTVNFDASGSSDPEGGSLTYFWDFGDGGTGIEAAPSHTYTAVGTYTAIVTVTDDFFNTDQASVEITVTAPNQPPTVGPTASPYNGTAPLSVQFTANGADPEGDLLTYLWDLGDGTSSSEANPLHTYSSPGTYMATVNVSDGEFVATGSVTISVGSPLACNVTSAKSDRGKKGKVKGKVNFKADFTYTGKPDPSDLITVTFDGITLLSVPFGAFKEDYNEPGEFKFKDKHFHMKIDFNKGAIKVSRHKMVLTDVDNSNGIDVVISFGNAACTDHFVMKEHDDDHDEEHEKKMSHKEKDDDH